MLAGGSAFLVCGGPSATVDKLQKLSERGHFSLAVNNKAGHSPYRPQAFVYSDTSSKFSHSIWNDPAIMKFCPLPKWSGHRAKLSRKDTVTKKFVPDGVVLDKPNVWGFDRRGWCAADDTFFTEPSAAWGNLNEGVTRTGRPKTVCTMLLGIRILYYLGARTIYLVGVDFNMQPGKEYSFNQGKESNGASNSNNEQYRVVNSLLTDIRKYGSFGKFGLKIFNCNDKSGLTAFPYFPFDWALNLDREESKVEYDPDLSHWYEKIEEDKMEQIEELVLQGASPSEIVDKMNAGMRKKKNHLSVEKVNTYLRVLNERYK